MSVPRLPARKLSTRRRHGDSDDEDVAVSVQRQRPPPVEELDEEADFASSVEDSDDDSDDGVHDPACRTDLYPAQSQRQSGEHRSLTLSLHHAFGIHQLRRQVSTSSSGASQWQEAASPHSGLRQGSHSITKASSNRTGTSSGKQNLDVGATDTPQRDRSPEDALQLRGTGALPSKASLPQGSIESRREGGANPTRGLSGSVPPGHVQAGRNPESEYLPLRGGLETSSSSSPADEWRSFSIAHPPPFTGLSRQPVSSWWGRISEGESNYVLPHVSKELCSDEYGKDNSKQVKCCGFCPLIFTRKGWKMFFSVFWQEDNFDLLLRNYVPEDPQRRQYTSHHSDSEHAGPPSNTMYSAGRAASQHRRLMHVGTSAGQYAGRVAQFSKEPESAVKHKAATRRIMKGYPFVTFRYQPLNRAYNYLLGQVVPVKVIWASLFALIGQALLSVGQTLMALNRTNLLNLSTRGIPKAVEHGYYAPVKYLGLAGNDIFHGPA
ncbi:conserved hypothetical protein [Neospora caninum Liverpool]|uniref:Uncharacterized protein n=1 Tax=Neospora caninum (strain Liverpool) TaxID=572307 RepID=F0VJM1_NEOCL|nr:conserved hypothetical protein [Neospora caninum Liverpool]CBZ53932.1 conserved hypothetical protein [Neospora caninum Liverpool]|eukprot:XP_003883964.1 conserved hypothetical protein [Neospora caninum Liverpool]